MMNVVFLVNVFGSGGSAASTSGAVAIPQTNWQQCEVNKKHLIQQNRVYSVQCVVGGLPITGGLPK